MKKLIVGLAMLLIVSLQSSFSQRRKGAFENFNLIVSTNPLLIYQEGMANALAGLNWRWLEFDISGSYRANEGRVEGFATQYYEYSIKPSIKLHPFNNFFNCLYRSIGHGKIISPCATFKEKKERTKPNGIYVLAGYVFERIHYNYLPDSELDSPISEFPFSIRNNGVQAEIGYQITIRWFSLGAGYGFFMSFPKKEGTIDPLGDSIYTGTYPFKYRLSQKINLQIGINLKL